MADIAGSSLPPGLCAACAAQQSRRPEALLAQLADVRAQEERLTAASSQCMRCHSGGQHARIACSNGECNVLYDRLGAARKLAAASVRMQRLGLGVDGSCLDW